MQAKELAQYLSRTVLVDKPRITKFKIDWADEVQYKQILKEKEKEEDLLSKADKTDYSNSTFSASKNICT